MPRGPSKRSRLPPIFTPESPGLGDHGCISPHGSDLRFLCREASDGTDDSEPSSSNESSNCSGAALGRDEEEYSMPKSAEDVDLDQYTSRICSRWSSASWATRVTWSITVSKLLRRNPQRPRRNLIRFRHLSPRRLLHRLSRRSWHLLRSLSGTAVALQAHRGVPGMHRAVLLGSGR